MENVKLFLLVLIAICLCFFALQAQKGVFALELNGGLTFYQGDIGKQTIGSFKGRNKIWGGGLSYFISDSWAIEASVHKGALSHADTFYPKNSYLQQRKFSFQALFTDLAFQATFIPFGETKLKPYLSTGIGLVFFSKDANLLRNEHLDLTDFIKADLIIKIPSIGFVPVDVGLSYDLTEKIALITGFQYNFTFTDYLDGVSLSGNPKNNDRYGQLNVGVRFSFLRKADIDKDGIADDVDACPFKPGLESTQGCPDADGDGIIDSEDRCVYAAGEQKMQGCPDTDKDGTADPYDRCPTKAGPPEVLGCPTTDSDHDGIDDHLDACPLKAGPPERNGCPAIDSDLDGILDENDQCPLAYGLIIFDGCPDADGDGIEDAKDACPLEFGFFAEKGCPVFTSVEEEIRVLNRQKLLFSGNSSSLANFALLDKLADFMNQYPYFELSIRGFADPLGSDENPNYISQLRSEKVLLYLQSKGVLPSSLLTQYFGAQNALSLTSGLLSQAKNRRVEFVLVKH